MQDFIAAAKEGNFVAAKIAFNNEMQNRVRLAVQARRVEIASQSIPVSELEFDDDE